MFLFWSIYQCCIKPYQNKFVLSLVDLFQYMFWNCNFFFLQMFNKLKIKKEKPKKNIVIKLMTNVSNTVGTKFCFQSFANSHHSVIKKLLSSFFFCRNMDPNIIFVLFIEKESLIWINSYILSAIKLNLILL